MMKRFGMTVRPLLPPALALRRVTSRSGKGVYASSDRLFKGAVFGRDSIEVAEDLLGLKPKLVRRIILTLASLQGEDVNEANEEEPGKIVHEYRTTIVDGKPLNDTSRHIFETLARRWGGTDHELVYFGSVDATPHFMRLVGAYCSRYGTEILEEKVTLRSGYRLSLALALENAADWLLTRLNTSRSGLVEYQRLNSHGIENQVWKDSREFYVHEDGTLANHEAPIASIEVQGLTYDALMTAEQLLLHKQAAGYKQRALALRDQTIELLWQKERHYFALGLDYGPRRRPQIIHTMTANPAALLDTGFFDELSAAEREYYVSSVVRTIMSREFLTDAGIRSRGLSGAQLIPFWDYHGSFTSWPKETYDIAKGLRRQGFPRLAKELENRLLNIILKSWEYPEFVYVDEYGRVLASSSTSHGHGDVVLIESTNNPERIQAWTVSAIVAIVSGRLASKLKRPKTDQAPWQAELERHILSRIPHVKQLLNPVALSARYPTYRYQLNQGSSQSDSNFLHKN